MNITGTHFNYYYVCHRKLWLFANGINMEHTSDLVSEGKLIHENSYPFRSDKYTEIELDGIKIDYYNARNQVVHEIKKSKSQEKAHEWQVKYYLYVLKQNGIDNPTGILEYPKLRKTMPIELLDSEVLVIQNMISEIKNLIESDKCPPVINSSKCKKCSYFDFCYSGESEQ